MHPRHGTTDSRSVSLSVVTRFGKSGDTTEPKVSRKNMERLFNVPELLEEILLFLPIPALLQAQRINKRFQRFIQASAVIQQSLFFQSIPSTHSSSCTSAHDYEVAHFDMPACEILSRVVTAHDDCTYSLNPVLSHFFHFWFRLEVAESEFSFRRHGNFKDLQLASDGNRLTAFLRPEASWRRMLVAQPAVPHLRISTESETMGGSYFAATMVDLPSHQNGLEGVRMEILYDVAAEWVHYEQMAWFSVQWDCLSDELAGHPSRDICGPRVPGMALDSISVPDIEGCSGEGPRITLALSEVDQCCPQLKPISQFVVKKSPLRTLKLPSPVCIIRPVQDMLQQDFVGFSWSRPS